MAIFRRSPEPTTEPEPEPTTTPTGDAARRKGAPTPSRRAAEAARRERLHPTLTKKEARQRSAAANRTERAKAMQARDNTPEKQLLRDHVDARRNLGEFLLPSLVVIVALTFLTQYVPQLTLIATVVMYVFILTVVVDCVLMWRSFKKLLAARLPRATTQGLMMYGMNRAIQIRRFRIPAPRIKRGEAY